MGKLHVKVGARKRALHCERWEMQWPSAASEAEVWQGLSPARMLLPHQWLHSDANSPSSGFVGWSRKTRNLREQRGFGGCRRVKKDDSWGGREERGRDFCPPAAIVLNSTHMPTSVFNPLLSAHDWTTHTTQPLCSPVNIWETMQRRMVEANIPVLGKIQSWHH